jgi:putative peptidoglycan lipid II flippase
MGLAAAASRFLGGARVLVVAAVLGTTFLGDAFEGANALPTVVFELLAAGALSAVLVPTFARLFDRGDVSEATRRAGGLLGIALVGLGALAVLGIVFAPAIAGVLVSAGSGSTAELAARQDLTTTLLRFFLPQLVLYPFGFLAIALLNARRVFALPAAAPIANTIVVVSALLLFREVAGADPGIQLDGWEIALLGLGGTLGVAAFVAVPTVALWRQGVPLRPRLGGRDPEVSSLIRLSGWAVLQHAGGALLLGAAIILGAATEGGVVAYRVAFYVFLAPYGILAQPIHTAVLPELSAEAREGDLDAFGRSVRWALDSLALVVLPASAALVALAGPAMAVLSFGAADTGDGVSLMAAGTASLAVGLFGYGSFRLLAAGWYALDDSRTPALVAVGSALGGVAFMVVVAPMVEGAALVAVLGLGHSAAFTVGAAVLGVGLWRRTGQPLMPRLLGRSLAASIVIGVALWEVMARWDPSGRLATLAALIVLTVAGGGAFFGLVRWRHWVPEARGPLLGAAA